ncbi:uncharacterized protein LOC112517758 [Cynara cardunculus var. scolymus]|uniref:Cotton fiber protein n=1 Tax=Cynara cardunculus var. scolymus TaxID=59895 RepID=A0A118JWP2_CYNCS|nr:uncharacterized protein LOC112517758 [Cynara cardunculus var. scolymus]KVH94704.1 Protein of unknown function DUF761, plant [Cynara cardunculus var. scolymus]
MATTPSSSPHNFAIRAPPPPPPSPSSSSSLATCVKFKTLIHNFIFSHLYRLVRALTKAKTLILELLKQIHRLHNIHFLEPIILKKNRNKHNKICFGSFRLHYNWCSSSHVVPMAMTSSPNSFNGVYYDSTWNAFVDEMAPESQLSGYLQWLEEKNKGSNNGSNAGSRSITVDEMNEIDRLADKFIANCHEKFRLEKQESYRRFQEMMARSM